MSETSRCRERLKKYCVGYGLDLGYGGDPIIPSAITVDLPQPYTKVGEVPLNLGGDARNLYWFTDNSLNYVFSSHLLEDFETHETREVLLEWLRVLVIGGHLVLYLPDEQVYRKHCANTSQSYNEAHKIENFSLAYIKDVLKDIPNIEIIHENPACEEYSFEIVIKKTGPTPKRSKEKEIEELKKAIHEKDNRIMELEQIISLMKNTRGWQLLERLRKIRNNLLLRLAKSKPT